MENGSGWIFPLFNDFEDLQKKMPQNFPRTSARRVPAQYLGQPVLGGLCLRCGEHRGLGQGHVRFGLPTPGGGACRAEGFWKYAEGMDVRRTYDFMGDNARRFMGLPLANPDPPAAAQPPALAEI